MKNLYIITFEGDFVLYTDKSEKEMDHFFLSSSLQDINVNEDIGFVSKKKITDISELPEEWIGCYPYGDDTNFTCDKILVKEEIPMPIPEDKRQLKFDL